MSLNLHTDPFFRECASGIPLVPVGDTGCIPVAVPDRERMQILEKLCDVARGMKP